MVGKKEYAQINELLNARLDAKRFSLRCIAAHGAATSSRALCPPLNWH